MAHHKLKIENEFMKAKTFGDKPFEVRYNDRGFQKGDTITYTETHPAGLDYEGLYEITYVTGFAQKENWVVFGDKRIDKAGLKRSPGGQVLIGQA
tara:strand:+ start:39464 stop:39748 length:285 start_codon:yes stop_codon:yes gene_type:complete